MKKHGGFMFMDALVGLLLLGVLIAVMGVLFGRASKTKERMAESREMVRAAENVMTAMQTGAAMPAVREGMVVKVKKLDEKATERVWVRVEAAADGRSRDLVGMAPAAGAAEGVKAFGGEGESK